MTINGALSDLNNLLKADDIPIYYKSSIKAVMDTIALSKPQEPKTGHWIDKFSGVYRCSCCQKIVEIDTEVDYPNGITWNFCPNCGADMRGEK